MAEITLVLPCLGTRYKCPPKLLLRKAYQQAKDLDSASEEACYLEWQEPLLPSLPEPEPRKNPTQTLVKGWDMELEAEGWGAGRVGRTSVRDRAA